MAVLSRGDWDQWAEVGGRKVKLTCRGGTQSINVCTAANRASDYEEVQYFNQAFKMTVDEVARFGDLPSLKTELRRRAYRQAG